MPFEYAVDGSTSQTHTGSNSTLLNALTGKCKHLMPNTHSGWTGHCSNNQKNFWKIYKYWFKVVTVWRLIWGNDHLYCGFGARQSHLTLHWMSAQGSVGFRWGTIMGPYHANFIQEETQKFDPHWFYCLQWGCNNLFVKSVCVIIHRSFATGHEERLHLWNWSIFYCIIVTVRPVRHIECMKYCLTSIISGTLIGIEIVDNSDVVGASPVGAASTTSSFLTEHSASVDWHNIPNCMKEVTWLKLCLCTNGHRSAALEWLPFILPPVFVQAAVIRSW